MRAWDSCRRFPQMALAAACLQTLLATAGPLPSAPATAPASPQATVPSAAQAQYDSLFACPTTLDHIGRVVIPVQVDGSGPFRFVVDTGASHSTVSPRLVRALGLTPSKIPLIKLEGVTGSAPVPAVKLETLQAGALTIRNTAVPVLDTPMMDGADGILGIAGIRNIALLVDFEQNRVRISRRLNSDVRFDYSRVHTRPVAGGVMAIPAIIGNVHALAIIDTGSERTLGNAALRRALHLQDKPGKLEPVTAVYGATSQVETGRMVSSPIIAIGPLRVAGVDLIYGDFHIFEVWGLESRPAIILGMDVLGTVDALGFDFHRHDLFVGGARPAGGLFSTIRTFRGGKASGSIKVSH